MQMFGKLQVPVPACSAAIDAVRALMELIDEAVESKLCTEAATRTALNKTRAALSKHITSLEHTRSSSAPESGSGSEKTTADVDEDVTAVGAQTPARRQTPQTNADEENEEEEEEEAAADDTIMTMTTNFKPDAEGTRIGDFFNDEEDDELQESDEEGTIIGKGERQAVNDESLVDSLLDSEDME